MPAKKKQTKKTAAKKHAKKAPAKKAPTKKAPAKKAPTWKAPAKKAPTRKAPAKKAPTKKAPTKKAPTKKAPTKKAPAQKPAATAPKSRVEMYRGANLDHHPVSLAQMATVANEGLRSDGEILQVESGAVAPCRLVDHGGGRFSLCLDDYAMPAVPLFVQLGLQGGGYTWEAVVQSLVKHRKPELVDELSYDSESGMFVAMGTRAALLEVAKLIQAAIAEPAVLRGAVERADPDTLE